MLLQPHKVLVLQGLAVHNKIYDNISQKQHTRDLSEHYAQEHFHTMEKKLGMAM